MPPKNDYHSDMYNKCKTLADWIEKDNKHAETDITDYPKFNECVVDFRDKELDKQLDRAGKMTGGWSTKGSVGIKDNTIPESDIPINMQTCRPWKEEGHVVRFNIGKLLEGSSCKIHDIHIHNGEENQSTHLRVECDDAGYNEMNVAATLIYMSHVTGRAICEGKELSEVREQIAPRSRGK